VAEHHGGAIYSAALASPTILNSILWDNDAGYSGSEICVFQMGASASISYSLVQGGEDAIATWHGATFEWGDGNIDVDPEYAFADDPHPTPNSPCIDAGTTETAAGPYTARTPALPSPTACSRTIALSRVEVPCS
jgi:hypothetical protein